MSNTSKLTFWHQDCCSRIYLRFLPFAFVNRAGKWVYFRGGDVPCWTRRHSPWLPAAGCKTRTAWKAKCCFLGWGKTFPISSELSLSTIFLSELIFLQKALTADFLKGVSMRFFCSMDILTLYLEILHKINFSCWKLEYFYSGRLLQCQGEA